MWGLLPPIFLSKYFVNIWWLQTKADRPKPKTFFFYFFRLKKGKSILTGTFFYSVINRSKIVFWPSSHQLMYFCCKKLKVATRNKSMFTIQIAKTMKILIQFAKNNNFPIIIITVPTKTFMIENKIIKYWKCTKIIFDVFSTVLK